MRYLLDTNAWIHYLKHAGSRIRGRLASLPPADVVLCSVVKAELLHGAEKYGHVDRRRAVLGELFAPYESLPFDDDAAARYGKLRHELELGGMVIGPLDLQIAAICLAHGLVLVTSNVEEFSRVRGLSLEDWLA